MKLFAKQGRLPYGKIGFAVGGLIIIIFCVIVSNGFVPCLIPSADYTPAKYKLKKGQIFNPLKQFDFTEGKWVIYIQIHPQELGGLPEEIPKSMCLKIDDRRMIESMKGDWDFLYTGADVATTQSSVYLLRNKKLVFKSDILLWKGVEGLQSQEFGWVEPVKKNAIIKYVKKAKKVYWPF